MTIVPAAKEPEIHCSTNVYKSRCAWNVGTTLVPLSSCDSPYFSLSWCCALEVSSSELHLPVAANLDIYFAFLTAIMVRSSSKRWSSVPGVLPTSTADCIAKKVNAQLKLSRVLFNFLLGEASFGRASEPMSLEVLKSGKSMIDESLAV